jgi:hypothetical protein
VTCDEQAPTRVMAAVLEQPVGISDGKRPLYEQMWRSFSFLQAHSPRRTT